MWLEERCLVNSEAPCGESLNANRLDGGCEEEITYDWGWWSLSDSSLPNPILKRSQSTEYGQLTLINTQAATLRVQFPSNTATHDSITVLPCTTHCAPLIGCSEHVTLTVEVQQHCQQVDGQVNHRHSLNVEYHQTAHCETTPAHEGGLCIYFLLKPNCFADVWISRGLFQIE